MSIGARETGFVILAVLCLTAIAPVARGEAMSASPATPSVDQKIADFDHQCISTAAERNARNQRSTLYQRLGGSEESMLRLTRQLMRYHYRNDAIYDTIKGYSPEALAAKFTPYLVTLTGGPNIYRGKDLKEAHRNIPITNAQFFAGGEDMMQALKSLGYAPAETEDLMCAIFALRAEVVQAH